MSQIFEALRRAEELHVARNWRKDVEMAVAERRESDRQAMEARIRVYGHGRGLSPFFEENSILNASDTGALLLMRVPVVAGQKLLLINEAAEQVQECRVVRTSCRGSQELEVAVEFPNPQPQFWSRLGRQDKERGIDKRKRPRITLPRGMDVTWRGRGESVLSKVETISSGGLSIVAPEPPSVGELLHVSFEVPAGEVSARAVVRHTRGEGMGIEFVAMSDEARSRLDQLLHKLLS
jgi:PilZ domain